MPRAPLRNRKRLASALLAAAAALALTACGSSSSPSHDSAAKGATNASGTTATGASGSSASSSSTNSPSATRSKKSAAGAGGSSAGVHAGSAALPRTRRVLRLEACLARNGITLPGGTRAEPLLGFLDDIVPPALPKGVTRAQYRAALRKCTGLALPGGFKGFKDLKGLQALKGLKGSKLRTLPGVAFARFAACMRQNGIDLPAPNTSGKGPVFNTKGVNVSSPQFRAADAKCTPQLHFGLFAHPQAGVGASSR